MNNKTSHDNDPIIQSPHQLRRMGRKELAGLAKILRNRIIDTVSKNGGHLSSNLGMAELTIALHYVFDFSCDRLFLDVGHQCYAHKLLTGRWTSFETLRQAGGMSGFPSPAESDYDLFYTGHAGTAISTAAGMAAADLKNGRKNRIVAVVGDASIVNGLSFEGMNNAALLNRQFLIILNDNSMAIDRTAGALARSLEKVRMDSRYLHLKESAENLLSHIPLGTEISGVLKHVREGLRTTLHGNHLFEALGFNYFGPIDGHNIHSLINVLSHLADFDQPTVLHVHTVKGQGCEYALEDPQRFHSPSAHKIENGRAVFDLSCNPTWTEVFSKSIVRLGNENPRLVAITAAMLHGTGLDKFKQAFPDRTFDVGIGESHAVAAAAGMAKGGLQPVVAIYSTFMQRALDQVFHECALQNLPVVFCMDRAGLVGQDGAVHHGFWDIAAMRSLPGMTVAAPAAGPELMACIRWALVQNGPVAIRYPRDFAFLPDGAEDFPPFETGRSHVVREGGDGTLLSYGALLKNTLHAADMLSARGMKFAVVNARFAKPLDEEEIAGRLEAGRPVITIEDHARTGGFGSAVLELCNARGLDARNITVLGIPDRFVPHASREHQARIAGLDPRSIASRAMAALEKARS